MLRRSISSGSTMPRPTPTARRRISTSSRSRWAEVRTFEWETPSRCVPGGKATAAATTGPASGPMPTSSTPATCRMPTRQRSVSRCGAAVAGPRRRFARCAPVAPIPARPGSKERGRLSKRPQPDERRQGGERPASVPPVGAVVPGEPDRLRAHARRSETEPEALPRAVEEPRTQVQVAELPPDRAALDGARVAPEAPVPARARGHDRVGREHSVLEREGDALAHERIASGRVPDEERARRGDPRPARVGADGKRLPRARPRADAHQLGRQLGPEAGAVDRRERVGADDDRRPVRAAIRLDAHAGGVAREVHDALTFPQLDAALARRPGERGVELAPADDAAEVRATDREGAARDGDARSIDPRVGNR